MLHKKQSYANKCIKCESVLKYCKLCKKSHQLGKNKNKFNECNSRNPNKHKINNKNNTISKYNIQNIIPKHITENIKPNIAVINIEPKYITENIEPKQVTENIELKQVIENIELKQVTENIEPKQVIENIELKQVTENVESKQVTENIEPKQVTENIESKQVTENVELKQIAENIESKQVTENIEQLLAEYFESGQVTKYIEQCIAENFETKNVAGTIESKCDTENIVGKYDIIYILKIFYEISNIEFVIKNINYFNKTNKILILANVDEDKLNALDENCKLELEQNYNTIFFPHKKLDSKFNIHMIIPIIYSFEYIIEKQIVSDYIILSTDSEIFIKNLDVNDIFLVKNNNLNIINDVKQFKKNSLNSRWGHQRIFCNHDILVNFFYDKKIPFGGCQCNGLVLGYDFIKKSINDFRYIKDNMLDANIQYAMDEIIFVSIARFYNLGYNNITTWFISPDNRLNKMLNMLNNKSTEIKGTCLKPTSEQLQKHIYDLMNRNN